MRQSEHWQLNIFEICKLRAQLQVTGFRYTEDLGYSCIVSFGSYKLDRIRYWGKLFDTPVQNILKNSNKIKYVNVIVLNLSLEYACPEKNLLVLA